MDQHTKEVIKRAVHDCTIGNRSPPEEPSEQAIEYIQTTVGHPLDKREEREVYYWWAYNLQCMEQA